jgi:hypothetical protein
MSQLSSRRPTLAPSAVDTTRGLLGPILASFVGAASGSRLLPRHRAHVQATSTHRTRDRLEFPRGASPTVLAVVWLALNYRLTLAGRQSQSSTSVAPWRANIRASGPQERCHVRYRAHGYRRQLANAATGVASRCPSSWRTIAGSDTDTGRTRLSHVVRSAQEPARFCI